MNAPRPPDDTRTPVRMVAFEHLWTPAGWLAPGLLGVDAGGRVVAVGEPPADAGAPVETVRGFAVPGMPNTHSHAFQRALAGRTESGSAASEDNLWTWRHAMYRLAERIGPDDLQALAAFAYMEMLEHGFTRVAEFHYLHHAPQGRPYAQRGEMSLRLAAAAADAGIGCMVVPTLYAHAGIGQAPTAQQQRFVHSVDAFARLLHEIDEPLATAGARLGVALHSLRAVAPDELRGAVQAAATLRDAAPLHIHVSETRHEVEEVQAGLGARPVQWLLDEVGLDRRWTLVHATHLSETERRGLAASGATAALCPMTEAMLGDGLFPLVDYQREGGHWAIGTDSHYASGVAAELRMLECGQRLAHARRNVLADAAAADARALHSGERLFGLALAGGRSFGDFAAPLTPGSRADVVVLDPASPALAGHDAATVLDAWLLSGAADAVQRVMCAGTWVVQDGRHHARKSITRAYAQTVRRLFA
ncbi:MAG: formimidoylglutamate deiminase [Betaproteobacteria bacterium]|nr:formimidoylglutamate deiminase [Betaproteobacteria bacterium]